MRGKRGGEETGFTFSSRVVGVERNITGQELAEQLEGGEDTVTEEFIICRNIQHHLQIILRQSNEAAYCNAFADCESGSDELCPILMVQENMLS